jgi:hypothetical protein
VLFFAIKTQLEERTEVEVSEPEASMSMNANNNPDKESNQEEVERSEVSEPGGTRPGAIAQSHY